MVSQYHIYVKKCNEIPCVCDKGDGNVCEKCGEAPCVCDADGGGETIGKCPECEKSPCICNKKVIIELGENQKRKMCAEKTVSFYDVDGKPISAEEFVQKIFGELPELFKDEEELRNIWSNPKTRQILLKELKDRGYPEEQLREFAKLINAENSDLFDVLEFIAFDKKPLTRSNRILRASDTIFDEDIDEKTKEFLEFVLSTYQKDGFETLSYDAFVDLLSLKYGSPVEAEMYFGDLNIVKTNFVKTQEKLYSNIR
jgi:type I restriction enzyme R subunit